MSESDRSAVQARAKRMVTQRQEKLLLAAIIVGSLGLAGSLAMFHRSGQAAVEQHVRNNLASMAKTTLQVKNQSFHTWIARSENECELGLMWVQPEEMADNQGMLFVFDRDLNGPFWMKNTLVPLDIAFIRQDGTVVDIQQMEPLSLVGHEPREPYHYALEVKAGTLGKAGLQVGDVIPVPADLLNR